jgi:glycine/D-amino acid oxidase-like deaminating enzyme
MNYSFWEKYFIETPSDITIVGSGIVGLSTAISIKERNPNLSIKVLERGSFPYGASTKNAGFSCFGSVSELLDDMDNMGEKNCMEVVKMRWQGLQKLKERVGVEVMDYAHEGGTELFRKTDLVLKQQCLDNLNYCNDLIAKYLHIENCYSVNANEKLQTFDNQCIYNQYEGTINPVAMMNQLKRICAQLGIEIVYGIEIKEIQSSSHNLVATNGLQILYNKLIICTNGFTKDLMPDLDVTPARNQVLMTKPLISIPLYSGYHLDKGYVYFRQYQGRILLGGGRNLDLVGETTSEFGNTELIQSYLVEILEQIYPGASSHIDHWWSGILGVGPSKYPIIQWHDKDVLIGVRLGGMGVAIGSYLGEQLAEMISSHS